MSSRLTKAQRDKVAAVAAATGASSALAAELLTAHAWSPNAAVNSFVPQMAGRAARKRGGDAERRALFERYRDPDDPDMILAEGISQLCDDLGVDPEDPVLLVLSWHFGAQTMCEYSRREFEGGLRGLDCESVEQLRALLPKLRRELDDPARFAEVYSFAYLFAREKGQKVLQQDVATALWTLLLPVGRWRHIDDWLAFLAERHNRAISRDTWQQLLEFVNTVQPDFSDFDEAGAWPYLLDEFVEYMREHGKVERPAEQNS